MVRASADYCHKELSLKAELATCQKMLNLPKPKHGLLKPRHAEAKAQHVDTAAALQQAHLNSIAVLD